MARPQIVLSDRVASPNRDASFHAKAVAVALICIQPL
jgi:hypothetical protein